ncbi:hypothetical protein DPEC_G00087080 [Dallia pectoralis]|uniref:Uncharacterized protein n=1 Tax=Dallia pectoralis TaxID=75939 RepID=A0ACC2H128_DALPE|nr:hypothetical protein DPEC_G00087080 [Dallia pectoralis]
MILERWERREGERGKLKMTRQGHALEIQMIRVSLVHLRPGCENSLRSQSSATCWQASAVVLSGLLSHHRYLLPLHTWFSLVITTPGVHYLIRGQSKFPVCWVVFVWKCSMLRVLYLTESH